MHPRKVVTVDQNLSLCRGQFQQALPQRRFISILAGQLHIGAVMPRFRFKQAAIELRQLAIRQPISQQTKPLTRPGFDQRRNQQAINGAFRFILADQPVQLAAIGAGIKPAELHPSSREQIRHQVIVLQFFPHNLGHRHAQFHILDIVTQQIERTCGSLSLAMRMIDEQFFQVGFDLLQPTIGGSTLQIQHRDECGLGSERFQWLCVSRAFERMLNDTIAIRRRKFHVPFNPRRFFRMILLSVQEIVKHYGPEPVLDGVTFDLRPGERAALVGPNGAGKTTLMQIIAGLSEPHSGRIEIHSRARLGYLEQQPEFAVGRTVWQEASSGLDELLKLSGEAERIATAMAVEQDPAARRKLEQQFDFIQHQLHRHDVYQADRRIEQILQGLGFGEASYQQPVEQLSGGQQNRLLLAKLLLADPDLLLLDEPSNHLDIDATEWLENYLTATDQAMLVVSHDRYFLDRVTNRTLELYQGTVESYPGNFTQYKRLKADRIEVQRKTYEKQQEEIARMEDFIRKNHYGVLAPQAEDRRKKLERIERVPPPREIRSPAMSFPATSRTGDIVLRVEKLSKAYDRPLFKDLTFDVLRGEKWGILGPNGSGKTTLLRCILGETKADAGRSVLGSGVKVGYFDQLLSSIPADAEVADAVRPDHKEFMIQQRRDLLARFGIIGETVMQKVSSLSGGERNRTALARLAALDANVLLLDEPTNHLDLWARDALEQALKNFDGTVIFVSHDRYFLNQVADKLLIVQPDRFRVIEGNYDTYLHLVKQGFARDARAGVGIEKKKDAETASANSQRADKDSRRKRKFSYRKPGDIEAEIHESEARLQELHASFAAPEILRDGSRVKQIQSEIASLETALLKLYEHWEEALEMNS